MSDVLDFYKLLGNSTRVYNSFHAFISKEIGDKHYEYFFDFSRQIKSIFFLRDERFKLYEILNETESQFYQNVFSVIYRPREDMNLLICYPKSGNLIKMNPEFVKKNNIAHRANNENLVWFSKHPLV